MAAANINEHLSKVKTLEVNIKINDNYPTPHGFISPNPQSAWELRDVNLWTNIHVTLELKEYEIPQKQNFMIMG